MTSGVAPTAVRLVRGWTRLYTSCLPPAVRDRRREEIESDLWEWQHDKDLARPCNAGPLLARLVLGIPDDLGWALKHAAASPRKGQRRLALTAGAACLLALWLIVPRLAQSPPLPDAPHFAWWTRPRLAPPPPPPPPPPCLPPALATGPQTDCQR